MCNIVSNIAVITTNNNNNCAVKAKVNNNSRKYRMQSSCVYLHHYNLNEEQISTEYFRNCNGWDYSSNYFCFYLRANTLIFQYKSFSYRIYTDSDLSFPKYVYGRRVWPGGRNNYALISRSEFNSDFWLYLCDRGII